MKTYVANKETLEKNWYVMDAEGVPLGRLAVTAAVVLKGKHRPVFTPHVDTGEFVVVVNADKIGLTGRKRESKVYRSHTGYLGHLKEIPYERMADRHPERVIELAVKRMLPKTKLGRAMFRKLKVYAGPDHPHDAQQPIPWNLGYNPGMKGIPGQS